MTNSRSQLRRVMGHADAIRADEASPFLIGKIARMGDHVTIHGLEYSNLLSGHGGQPASLLKSFPSRRALADRHG